MLPNFTPDRASLERDPNLVDLEFDAGAHSSAYESEVGQSIFDLLTSRLGVGMLIGAVCSAQSRPPVAGIEPLLFSQIGDPAFEDDMKRLAGRIVRYIIEHLGGHYGSRGVKITEALGSHYKSGSTYYFDKGIRG